jgi:hypothetical protein
MQSLPWAQSATVWRFTGGLAREKLNFDGDLSSAVAFAMSQPSLDVDHWVISLNDASQAWEGQQIIALAEHLSTS